MLLPYQMSSVIITGPKTVQEDVIKELHELKVLHIVEHSKNELADIGLPLESASRLSEILVRVRALISALSLKIEENGFELKKNLFDIQSSTKRLSEELNLVQEELKKTEELLSKNENVRQELEILKDIDLPLEAFSSYKSLAYFTGYLKEKNALAVKSELPKITKKYMLLESLTKNKYFVVLFVDFKHKEHASSLLQKNGFSPISFVNITSLKGSASSNLKKVEEESAKLHRKREELRRKIDKLKDDCKGFLFAAEEFLGVQLEKAEAPLKFASTPTSFLIKGWVPAQDLRNAIERLNKASKGKIFVHFEPAKKHDNVPIKLKNPKYAKSFEFFIDLYSMPTYKEIDPTFFVFLTFPILFGIMLGDIGYGLVSLVSFWALKKAVPKAKNFFNILMLASFMSIIFGILFGEFFGFEEIRGIHLWHVLSRTHDMFTLLYIAIAIGVIHVNIGLIIGFVNELRAHGLIKAIYEKASWIVLEIGVAFIALPYLGKIDISPLVGAIFLGLSILMLFKVEGIKGIIEIPGIFTNILSYARLMAIGLSSVILATIINESAEEFFHQGGFFVLIGVLILIIGHIINIVLGLLTSFLHSLRLHYVEFFSKFFHGGAKKYLPFGARE